MHQVVFQSKRVHIQGRPYRRIICNHLRAEYRIWWAPVRRAAVLPTWAAQWPVWAARSGSFGALRRLYLQPQVALLARADLRQWPVHPAPNQASLLAAIDVRRKPNLIDWSLLQVIELCLQAGHTCSFHKSVTLACLTSVDICECSPLAQQASLKVSIYMTAACLCQREYKKNFLLYSPCLCR